MADKNKGKIMEVRFDHTRADSISLKGALTEFESGNALWEFTLYQHGENSKILIDTDLNGLIELVLLGKSRKAQLQAQTKLCDLCGKPTTGQNPHYDCEQREAYLANNLREVLDNG